MVNRATVQPSRNGPKRAFRLGPPGAEAEGAARAEGSVLGSARYVKLSCACVQEEVPSNFFKSFACVCFLQIFIMAVILVHFSSNLPDFQQDLELRLLMAAIGES